MAAKNEAVIDGILREKISSMVYLAYDVGKQPREVAKELGLELPDSAFGLGVGEAVPPEELLQEVAAEIKALLEVKELLQNQHAETTANFLAIEKRDEHSSKQNLWLTLTTSAISLIVGWLLSLLGSPATLIHAFGG